MKVVLPTTYARTRIYRPRKEVVVRETLKSADVTDVCIPADDKVRLNGWYALSRAESDGPRPLIVYFSGASGHRGYRLAEMEMLTSLGGDVLLVDYRGYGDNEGQPCERHQTRDARAVWRFATDELHVPADRIVVFGESIGGGVATRLVSELCRRSVVPGGLILQATFASMLDVVSQFFPRVLSSIFLIDRYPSARLIRHVTCPILSIHGDDDRLIPIEMGRRLFAAAPPSSAGGCPKEFLELPGVDHNDILDEAGPLVEETISRFLQRAVSTDANSEMSREESSGLMQPLR